MRKRSKGGGIRGASDFSCCGTRLPCGAPRVASSRLIARINRRLRAGSNSPRGEKPNIPADALKEKKKRERKGDMRKIKRGRKKEVIIAVILVTAVFVLMWGIRPWKTRPSAQGGSVGQVVPVPQTRRALDGVFVEKEKENPAIAGVMIENVVEAQPLSGIAQARQVFEAVTEANITRFLAYFVLPPSPAPTAVVAPSPARGEGISGQFPSPRGRGEGEGNIEIGPVRSARPYFLDWASEFDTLYGHVGSSPAAYELLRKKGVEGLYDFDQWYRSEYFFTKAGRAKPHHLYTSAELLGMAHAKELTPSNSPLERGRNETISSPARGEVRRGGSNHAYLITSPEYAHKKLLAAGFEKTFEITKAFRGGEPFGGLHNPEFTMIEWYRAGADYTAIMDDVEKMVQFVAAHVSPEQTKRVKGPWERISVVEAFKRYADTNLDEVSDEETFFKIFLTKIERKLGVAKPTILYDYPASMASLARLKPSPGLRPPSPAGGGNTAHKSSPRGRGEGEGRYAERFEVYIAGMELGNAFSELNDGVEQRRRFMQERALRKELGKEPIPLDEDFLDAVGNMPPSAGIALGIDRLVMLLTNAATIEEVLAFPARELFGPV